MVVVGLQISKAPPALDSDGRGLVRGLSGTASGAIDLVGDREVHALMR
jgi:hypothetical protein